MSKISTLITAAVLLMSSEAAFAETVITMDLSCYHLKTLQLIDQQPGIDSGLIRAQIKSGECSFYFKVGTSVRVDQRFEYPLSGKTDVCIAPAGSSEPCQWTSSKFIK
jgi:hypothetical protein